nr:MAG TPA: hypothetical protein [Caudoviricetes sp.]
MILYKQKVQILIHTFCLYYPIIDIELPLKYIYN